LGSFLLKLRSFDVSAGIEACLRRPDPAHAGIHRPRREIDRPLAEVESPFGLSDPVRKQVVSSSFATRTAELRSSRPLPSQRY
jgi:hypothetical protein